MKRKINKAFSTKASERKTQEEKINMKNIKINEKCLERSTLLLLYFRAAMQYDFMNVEYKKILVWAK